MRSGDHSSWLSYLGVGVLLCPGTRSILKVFKRGSGQATLQGRPKTPKPIQGAANGTKNRTPHIRPRTTRATPALSLQRILLASCLCLCFGRHHLQARHNKAAYHKPQTSSMRTESLITCLALKQQTQWHPPVQTPAAKTLSAVP